jgi:CubicO group peptidase (beta-lactamase class C family)
MGYGLFLLLSGCGGNIQPSPPPGELTDSYNDIPALLEHYNVPGASIVTIKNFQIDRIIAVGVKDNVSKLAVTPDTLFQAASISKSLTAVAVMKAAQNGELDLDADINDLLGSWHLPDSIYTDKNMVTLRRLLGHTAGTNISGFDGYNRASALPTTIQILAGESPANSRAVEVTDTPGSKYRYSGGGYTLLQLAMTDYFQQPFNDWMNEQVLSPLAMSNSSYEQPLSSDLIEKTSSGHYSNGNKVDGDFHVYPEMAAAGLWTTAEDLANYTIELQKSLIDESNVLLVSASLNEMMEAGPYPGYGLGFELFRTDTEGYGYFGHTWSNVGFRAIFYAHKTAGVGLVMMTNSANGGSLYNAVLQLVGKLEKWPGY